MASPTKNPLATIFTYFCHAQSAAFPAKGVSAFKQISFVPAFRTGYAVMTRLDACITNLALLRVDQSESCVVNRVGEVKSGEVRCQHDYKLFQLRATLFARGKCAQNNRGLPVSRKAVIISHNCKRSEIFYSSSATSKPRSF